MNAKVKHVVPISSASGLQCTVTPPWFVNSSEYKPVDGTFDFLINGERAFAAVHKAIAFAKKSVCIICWGFQPSMYFVRNGALNVRYEGLPEAVPAQIGKLLEYKAKQGIKVYVLSYAFEEIPATIATISRETTKGAVRSGWKGAIGGLVRGATTDDRTYVNVTGAKIGLGESNTPGRHDVRVSDQPSTSSDEMHKYDIDWYERYDHKQEKRDMARNARLASRNPAMQNLTFLSRDYTMAERQALLNQGYVDKHVSRTMRYVLAGTPSHHQKMVLVDHESPADHLGFVMGHNMLDAYWDKDSHSITQRQKHAPWLGPNGELPRQDLSSRVSGPICDNLFRNFSTAWKTAGGKPLPDISMANYPLRQQFGPSFQCQIVRTYPTNIKDIQHIYLKAVNNASQYIYIENQYFRWPPLADKIKQAAAKQCQWGRDPAQHSSLYLFVVTNSSDDGLGSGTVKTHEMLSSLGRADTMPGVELQNRADSQAKTLEQADNRLRQYDHSLGKQVSMLPNPAVFKDGKYPPAWLKDPKTRAAIEEHNRLTEQRNKLRAEQEKMKKDLELLADKDPKKLGQKMKKAEVVAPQERPGLKVHVCTLVPPDTPAGRPWPEVYVHSKLMLVNDTFMTLGSANINSRSMAVDSELNIAHHNQHISKKARLDLWHIHTKGIGAQEDVSEAFEKWEKLIKDNKRLEMKQQPPLASLRGFLRFDPKQSDMD